MFEVSITLLSIALLLTLYRFIKTTTLADRVVAFDVLGIMSISLLVLLSLSFQREIYLDIALVLALIGFLTTTLFGRYIEKGL